MSKRLILNIPFDCISKKSLLWEISKNLDSGKKTFIVTANAETVMLSQKNKEFRKNIVSADFIIADGIGILWAGNFLSSKIQSGFLNFLIIPIAGFFSLFRFLFSQRYKTQTFPERIAGADLFWDLAKIAQEKNKSIFLLGGYGGVAEKTALTLKNRYSKIKIAGFYEGNPQDKTIVKRINNSQAEILFVAWGQPKQENFIAENFNKIYPSLAIGFGGTFDFVAGKRKRAPKFFRMLGLEWLWRFLIEPARAGRIFVAVPKFVYAVIKYKIKDSGGNKN